MARIELSMHNTPAVSMTAAPTQQPPQNHQAFMPDPVHELKFEHQIVIQFLCKGYYAKEIEIIQKN